MRLFKTITRRLTTLRIAVLSAVVGLLCAFWSLNSLSLLPPKIEQRHVSIGAAATHVMVDAPRSWVLDQKRTELDFESLERRADLLANLMGSDPVRAIISRRTGIPADQITARTRLTGDLVTIFREPASEQRATQILQAAKRYRLDIQSDSRRPIVHVFAQAPSAPAAAELANAAVASLREYLPERARTEPGAQVRLNQMGRAQGAVINGGIAPQIALLAFLLAFGLSFGLLVLARRAHAGWAAADAEAQGARSGRRDPVPPRDRLRGWAASAGDWPRTPRALPWMVAGFLAMLWLVPFNTIELAADLPFDLKLDRLVLPFLIVMWIVAITAGGREAPRLRLTWIHVGIGAFLAVACLSVVINAQSLNQALEFELATKRIVLLVAYVALFLLIASVVRPTEVPAFLKLTLGLAALCAIGTVWEYRSDYNVFYDVAGKLLSGIFSVGAYDPGAVDDIGRSGTRGPGEHPLETATMLAMALPIALVGIMRAGSKRTTALYGLAACLLFAAAISTYRKSAILAPLSVILTLAYFRRADLLRLAPLAAVGVVVATVLSPSALGSIAVQLRPDRLAVTTVSDRTADYDAIRPDLWSHMIFGRGYGSYDPISYRILDSEILGRIVETGVVGVLCFMLMLALIVLSARGPIRARDPLAAPAALAVAASAVAFLTASFLYDTTAFPHVPYILISLAGLLAVLLGPQPAQEPEQGPRWHSHAASAGRQVARRARVAEHEPSKLPASG